MQRRTCHVTDQTGLQSGTRVYDTPPLKVSPLGHSLRLPLLKTNHRLLLFGNRNRKLISFASFDAAYKSREGDIRGRKVQTPARRVRSVTSGFVVADR